MDMNKADTLTRLIASEPDQALEYANANGLMNWADDQYFPSAEMFDAISFLIDVGQYRYSKIILGWLAGVARVNEERGSGAQ